MRSKFSLLPPMLLIESIMPLVNPRPCQMVSKDGSFEMFWCFSLKPFSPHTQHSEHTPTHTYTKLILTLLQCNGLMGLKNVWCDFVLGLMG